LKKSDTLTVLIGLVITGVGWRYGGPQWGISVAIGAAAAFLLVHFLWKERAPTSAFPAQTITDSFKQSTSGSTVTAPITPSAKIEQHIHFPTTPTKAEPKSTKIQPSPNIEFIKSHTQRVGITDGGMFFIPTREFDRANPLAALACFRNEPRGDATIPDAYNVRAQVLYRDQNDTEIDDIPSACWIDEGSTSVSLPLGTTKCLILMLMLEDGRIRVPWNGDRFTDFRVGQISTIEVRLISKNKVLISSKLAFADDNYSIDAIQLP
jgi:hypothetical protein